MGMTVDEAIAQLDKYIDDACLANLAQITVVHGKGTGALRKGLHNYFKQLKKQNVSPVTVMVNMVKEILV